MTTIYETGLDKCEANYTPLSPLSFLQRAASVYPEYPAIIDGERRLCWGEVALRCRRLAAALKRVGVGKNDTVAVLAPNSGPVLEAHFGVPLAGAVLNTINTRLDAATIGFILNHGQAKVLLVDGELAALAREALALVERRVVVVECVVPGAAAVLDGLEYEAFLDTGGELVAWELPADEWDAIALNYTSGTTGKPKGVVYHHRGAYLNALSNAVGWDMGHHPVYLWTLPMFHCNGWCFPWTLAALAGTSVCLRRVNAKTIYDAIADHGVTHFCGAPIVMGMVLNARAEERQPLGRVVKMMTAAAPPPAAVLEAMAAQGFEVTHVYGLTETYGPAVICAWKSRWDALDSQGQADVKARQGVNYHALEALDILEPKSMVRVTRDGEAMGEAMFRGNIVMKGYLGDPEATAAAFRDGWFHSGDLGVMHADNYIQLKDRSKDIIISGGENISSIEVEDCLYAHPDIAAAAVVAKPDERWGETPCAFVELAPDCSLSAQDIIEHCCNNLAHYKVPRHVVFAELPRTSTGKVQKFKLRQRARGEG